MTEIAIADLSPAQRRLAVKARDAAERGEVEVARAMSRQILSERPECVGVRELWFKAELQVRRRPRGWWQGLRQRLGGSAKAKASAADPMADLRSADVALAADFTNPVSWRSLIQAARALALPETTLLACQTYAKLRPHEVAVGLGWAEALLNAGRAAEALEVAQTWLQKKPNDSQVVALVRRASVKVTMKSGRLGASSSENDSA